MPEEISQATALERVVLEMARRAEPLFRLLRWLPGPPAPEPAPGARFVPEAIRWWESRRPRYNLITGAAGLVTLGTALAAIAAQPLPAHPPGPAFPQLLPFAAAYGFMANLGYTFGWITEILIGVTWGVRSRWFGPIAFSIGTAASVLITLAPGAFFVLAALAGPGHW